LGKVGASASKGGSNVRQTEHRSFEKADEVREFPNSRAETVRTGGCEVGHLVFASG
jgi:hypothetical protein